MSGSRGYARNSSTSDHTRGTSPRIWWRCVDPRTVTAAANLPTGVPGAEPWLVSSRGIAAG